MKRSNRSSNGKRRGASLLSFLVGRVVLSGEGRNAAEIISLCMRCSLFYGDLTLREDGRVYLTASYGMAQKIRAVCARFGIELREESRSGIREAMRFCISRPGLLVGAVLGIMLLITASTHLWEIRVTGNSALSETEVVSELSAAGLALGTRIRGIDVDEIENRLLLNSDRISWLTVNLIGTVAEVQIREKVTASESDTADTAPANLVARCDGVIVSCEVLHGNLLVKVGNAVRKGEVLVSGLYDSNTMGYRYTHAAGEIYAETEHEFLFEIPYAYEKTAHMEETGKRYTLLFFGRRISLFGSDGFAEADTCEDSTVERISYIRVFGKDLPIGLSCETAYAEETVTGTYTPERAMEIAYFRLSEAIAALPGMMGILEKSISYEVGEDEYVLRCRIRCIENIAETKPIELGLFDGSR